MPHVYKYGVLLINVSFTLTDAKIPDLEKAEKEHFLVSRD